MRIKISITTVLVFICSILSAQDLTASLKVPPNVNPGEEFSVEVSLKKGSLSGFMKYFMEIPEGFTASTIDSRGGSFTFENNGVKIVWISPPSDPEFVFSYKIVTTAAAVGTKSFGAKISYIVNNERKIFDLQPVQIVFGKGSAVVKPVASAEKKPAVPESKPAETSEKKETVKKEEPKKEQPKEIKPVVESAKIPVSASATKTGKTYKVQIGAFSAKPKIEGVQEVSTVVLENGITKYFTGNFSTYEEASKRRTEMVSKGFQGAFIVAFENGKIIK
jgi:hypothetical protein